MITLVCGNMIGSGIFLLPSNLVIVSPESLFTHSDLIQEMQEVIKYTGARISAQQILNMVCRCKYILMYLVHSRIKRNV